MNGVVVLDRSSLERVAARGSDRVGFLHNMLSADIKKLGAGRGTEATFLTNKGKLIAYMTVFADDDQLLMEMESTRVSSLMESLSRYIISENVVLEHLQEEASLSVEGPDASKILGSVAAIDSGELDALPHLGIRRSGDVRVTARCFDPSPRFDVAASPATALTLLNALRDAGATVAGPELARARRIESGRPQFGIDVNESHLPLEASLNDAISFDKGCYIGQEYVVRLAHRGHLNRKLVGLRIDSPAPPLSGAKVMSGETAAGEVTSAAYSPTLGVTVALGYVRSEFFEPGTELEVDDRKAVVSALPFAKNLRAH
jgi:folate-binding protein YgfZ